MHMNGDALERNKFLERQDVINQKTKNKKQKNVKINTKIQSFNIFQSVI